MFQKMHKLYLPSGQCSARVTSPQPRLSSTKLGWIYMAENKCMMGWTTVKHMHLFLPGLQSGLWQSLASFSPEPFGRLILLWHTLKLPLSWTSTWNCPKVSRLQLETPRIMYWSYSRTSMVRSKLEECGIHSMWTSSPHWDTLLC